MENHCVSFRQIYHYTNTISLYIGIYYETQPYFSFLSAAMYDSFIFLHQSAFIYVNEDNNFISNHVFKHIVLHYKCYYLEGICLKLNFEVFLND